MTEDDETENFVIFDREGRMLEAGYQARMFNRRRAARGDLVLVTPERYDAMQDAGRLYIKNPLTDPVVAVRPVIDWGFDKTELMPREQTKLADIPPGEVTFTGTVRGQQPHETFGPVEIGWTTPGDYVVSVNAFPYKPATFALTVKGKLPVSVSANVGVKL